MPIPRRYATDSCVPGTWNARFDKRLGLEGTWKAFVRQADARTEIPKCFFTHCLSGSQPMTPYAQEKQGECLVLETPPPTQSMIDCTTVSNRKTTSPVAFH